MGTGRRGRRDPSQTGFATNAQARIPRSIRRNILGSKVATGYRTILKHQGQLGTISSNARHGATIGRPAHAAARPYPITRPDHPPTNACCSALTRLPARCVRRAGPSPHPHPTPTPQHPQPANRQNDILPSLEKAYRWPPRSSPPHTCPMPGLLPVPTTTTALPTESPRQGWSAVATAKGGAIRGMSTLAAELAGGVPAAIEIP